MLAGAATLVQEQLVADAEERARKAAGRSGNTVVQVGVARDEQVLATVAVHVADGSAGRPPVRRHARSASTLAEVSRAVVPQQQVVPRRRHVEVRVAVRVEVGGDAPASLDRMSSPGRLADLGERPAVVAVEHRRRQATALAQPRRLGVGVRVDDEEVEATVAVRVEPAEARAHHRHDVRRRSEPERSVPEVEADVVRDVDEACRAGVPRGRQPRLARVVGRRAARKGAGQEDEDAHAPDPSCGSHRGEARRRRARHDAASHTRPRAPRRAARGP